MAENKTQSKSGDLMEARLNQPRVSLEYLKAQEMRHRQAAEEFFEAAKKETSKSGRETAISGAKN